MLVANFPQSSLCSQCVSTIVQHIKNQVNNLPLMKQII